jgi:hypothetical protein
MLRLIETGSNSTAPTKTHHVEAVLTDAGGKDVPRARVVLDADVLVPRCVVGPPRGGGDGALPPHVPNRRRRERDSKKLDRVVKLQARQLAVLGLHRRRLDSSRFNVVLECSVARGDLVLDHAHETV